MPQEEQPPRSPSGDLAALLLLGAGLLAVWLVLFFGLAYWGVGDTNGDVWGSLGKGLRQAAVPTVAVVAGRALYAWTVRRRSERP